MGDNKVWKEDGDVERESMSTSTPPGVEKRDEHLACHTGPEPDTKETSNAPASLVPD